MRPTPTGREKFFAEDQIIVSKTDLQGKITYANHVFVDVAGYTLEELVGAPHSLIRHPEMPRVVFSLLWEQIKAGREIFAVVNNLAKTGENYWVLAHVTPSFDERGGVVGYHSNRRVPPREAVRQMSDLYRRLVEVERAAGGARDGIAQARNVLQETLHAAGVSYDEFVFSVIRDMP